MELNQLYEHNPIVLLKNSGRTWSGTRGRLLNRSVQENHCARQIFSLKETSRTRIEANADQWEHFQHGRFLAGSLGWFVLSFKQEN